MKNRSPNWRWFVPVAGLFFCAFLSIWMHQRARTALDRTLEAMDRIGAVSFTGGLTMGHRPPISPGETNPAMWKLPPSFLDDATNALPALLSVLRLHRTGGAESWTDSLPRWARENLPLDTDKTKIGQSIAAFHALGTNAASAIPELGRMLTNYGTSTVAAHALIGIGPSAIPEFITASRSSNHWIRGCGAWGLGQLGSGSRPHVDNILNLLQPNPSAPGNSSLLAALGGVGGPPKRVVPVLLAALQGTDAMNIGAASLSLRRLNQLAELPPDHPEGWPAEERRWFAAERPALVAQLKKAAPVLTGPSKFGEAQRALAIAELEAAALNTQSNAAAAVKTL